MSDVKKQASKMLAEEIIRAIKKLTADNNKRYVNPQIQNYRFTVDNLSSDIRQSISDIAKDTSIDQSTIDKAVQDAVGDLELDASQIIDLDAKVAEITVLEVEKATIDTAQIENLYATVADIIYLAAEKAEIGDLEAQKITSAIAELGLANIGSADIGFAQIKDLVSNTAIIREGVGGKLYIDRLAVTDAQILSLTTGELVMQGSDGKLYTVFVDDNGVVQTKLRIVSGDDIADGTILGDNIAENTITGALITEHGITARELNVSQIFADEALIGAIKAANIDVADLSANSAFIASLVTSLIEAPNFGSDIDISKNSSIELTNERLNLIVESESSATELILTDQMLKAISDHIQLIADTIDLSANKSIRLNISSSAAPSSPELDMIWLDTGVTPNLLKRWDGSTWVVVNDNSDLQNNIEEIKQSVVDLNADLSVTEGNITALTERIETTESDIDGLTADVNEAKATLTPEGLNVIVEQCQVVEDINGNIESVSQETAKVGVTADKIYWLIDSDSSSSSAMVLTEDAAKVISEKVTLTAEQINLVADDIDLSSNQYIASVVEAVNNAQVTADNATIIQDTTAPEHPSDGALWLDIGVNPSVLRRWDGAQWLDVSSTDELWTEVELSKTEIRQLTQEIALKVNRGDLETYLQLTQDGVVVGRNDSAYRVYIENGGYHVQQYDEAIMSLYKRTAYIPYMRYGTMNKSSYIADTISADGGIMTVRIDN